MLLRKGEEEKVGRGRKDGSWVLGAQWGQAGNPGNTMEITVCRCPLSILTPANEVTDLSPFYR